jgi:tripartite-type tricarboxylate transporter receptor subunit TctC
VPQLRLPPDTAGYQWQALHVVAPFAQDGATDLVTRLVATELGRRLGVAVTVDNQPGDGGTRGAARVARSRPDGHTLVMGTSSTHGICASVFRDVPYDFARDFAPVALVARAPNVLVVGAHSGIATVAELIAMARARPDALTFGSAGFGQTIHLCGELFKAAAAVELVHAPRGGSAQALAELAAGGITLMFDSLLSALPYIRRGALRALAVTSASRAAQLPDIPTLAESGVAGYDVTVWIGLLAPAAAPAPVVARLNAEVNAVLATPAIREQMEAMGAQVAPGSPQDFAHLIGIEAHKWADIVMRTGVKA